MREEGGAQPPAVAAVQDYLDGLHGLVARFQQIGPGDQYGSGRVWYDPGRLRLEYDPEASLLVVASGGRLVAYRKRDDATTRVALAAHPLGLLLVPHLRLGGEIEVTDVERRPDLLQISLARRAAPSQGLLTLLFRAPGGGAVTRTDAPRLGLLSLEADDARGQRTRLRLLSPQTGLTLSPQLFVPPQG